MSLLDVNARLAALGVGEGALVVDAEPEELTGIDRWLALWEQHTYISGDVKLIPPPEPLVEGILDAGTFGQFIGSPGTGKSVLAIDFTLCLATGTAWNGRPVRAGPVVYIAAEGTTGLGIRMDAWEQHHGRPDMLHPVHWLTIPVNVFNREQAAALKDYCAAREPVLIVVDTMARCIVGADENTAKDMGEIVFALEEIVRLTGACVLIVHHTGKDAAKGGRGSNSVLGAVSTEIEIGASGTRHTLEINKQKEHKAGEPIVLDLIQVGDSVVLTPASFLDRERVSLSDPEVLHTLSVLRSIEVPGGISATNWREAVGDDGGVGKTTFFKHRKALEESGLIVNSGSQGKPMFVTKTYKESTEENGP